MAVDDIQPGGQVIEQGPQRIARAQQLPAAGLQAGVAHLELLDQPRPIQGMGGKIGDHLQQVLVVIIERAVAFVDYLQNPKG